MTTRIIFNGDDVLINNIHVPPQVYTYVKRMIEDGPIHVDRTEYEKIKVIMSRLKPHLRKTCPGYKLQKKGYLKTKSLRYEIVPK